MRWNHCSPTLPVAATNYGGIFDFDVKSEKLEQVNGELEDPTVWNDPKRAQDLGKEKKSLEDIVHTLTKIDAELRDARDLFDMAREEHDDETLESVESDTAELAKKVEAMEFRRMFSNPMDPNNCFIDIQAGAGGTEALAVFAVVGDGGSNQDASDGQDVDDQLRPRTCTSSAPFPSREVPTVCLVAFVSGPAWRALLLVPRQGLALVGDTWFADTWAAVRMNAVDRAGGRRWRPPGPDSGMKRIVPAVYPS